MKKVSITMSVVNAIMLAILTTFNNCDLMDEDFSAECKKTELNNPFTISLESYVQVLDVDGKAVAGIPVIFQARKIPCDQSTKPVLTRNAKTDSKGNAYAGLGYANFNINNSKDQLGVNIEVYDGANQFITMEESYYTYNQFKDLPEFDTHKTIRLPKKAESYTGN